MWRIFRTLMSPSRFLRMLIRIVVSPAVNIVVVVVVGSSAILVDDFLSCRRIFKIDSLCCGDERSRKMSVKVAG